MQYFVSHKIFWFELLNTFQVSGLLCSAIKFSLNSQILCLLQNLCFWNINYAFLLPAIAFNAGL